MAVDTNNYSSSGQQTPAGDAKVIIPADADLALTGDHYTRAIFVGGAGNLTVKTAGGDIVTFTGVVAGSILPLRVSQIRSTLTTATDIVALW